MDTWRWHARIDTDEEFPQTLGAGFLIDSQCVLTCAHVVTGLATVRVSLSGGPEGLRACIERPTNWTCLGDDGDLALVRLDVPTSVPPARFARPEGRYWLGELRAHGFRRGFEQTGSYVTLRTACDMRLGRDWWQLEVDRGRPERLAEGFSGAAVYQAETGEVIGMVSDADLDSGGRMGRMLPLDALRRHWEDLDDLLPLPWLTGTDRQRLHQIVRDVSAPVRQAYVETFREPAPLHEFRSVWDAICYVAEQRGKGELAPFLGRLARYVPRGTAHRLAAWGHRALGAEIASGGGGQYRSASIIARLVRRTHDDLYELSLVTMIDGIPGPISRTMEVRGCDVRSQVELHLPELVGYVRGTDWMIEFVLPESWLSKPVEEWAADGEPMLLQPVVVRDVERLKPGTRRWERAGRRWATLRDRGLTQPEHVACTDRRTRRQFYYWLASEEDVCVLVHSHQPNLGHLTSALEAGIPVMVWSRSACRQPERGECARGRLSDELVTLIADTSPDELPKLVRKLRLQALAAPNGQSHCGRRLTLFWDDPARLPDPPLRMAP
jgi:hypothetical protein